MTSSVVILPTAKFRDTHTSFFNFNKSQVNTVCSDKEASKIKSKQELKEIILDLETKYFKVDDKFEE